MERERKMLMLNVKPATGKIYETSYLRLRALLELRDKRRPVKKVPLELVIDKLNTMENANTKYSLFVIVKKIFYSEKTKETIDALDLKIRDEKRTLQVKKNVALGVGLPSYKELNDALKKESNPLTYIVNFLFIRVNTRNQDVAFIDLHKNVEDESALDKNRNHLILKKDKALLIRNVYKTRSTYGVLRNVISHSKFIINLMNLLGDKDKVRLFEKKDGSGIAATAIGSYFKRHQLLSLTEGQIAKVVLKYIDEKGSYDMLRRVSQNRGTSISTLLREYDISNINSPGESIPDASLSGDKN